MRDEFETKRLWMRAITLDDVDLLMELNSDPEVMRFLSGGKPSPRAQVEAEVRRSLGHRWVAFEPATGEFVGWFGMSPSDDGRECELGYRMRQAAWGRGLATEGSLVLIAAVFSESGVERVFAQTMTVNVRSRAVMERCGMQFVRPFFRDSDEPIAGSELGDVEYELTREEWNAD
jgi:RimJ/RimL family protein N-acetyltransferase